MSIFRATRLLSAALLTFSFATDIAAQTPSLGTAQTLENGLIVTDTKLGTGPEAIQGSAVRVHYTGWLYDPNAKKSHGKRFDSSIGRRPFEFQLGIGMVIPGWDQGVAGMKAGGKRTLVIPSTLAYGEEGAGGVIPSNATLIFDVELLSVK